MPKRNYPTANEMLTALDAEDARQREALRRHLERNQPHLEVTGKLICWFFIKVIFWAAVLAAIVIGAMSL